jgi:3-hydroxy acid dehydrogenase/malonic semialdehyde reductase
MKGALITGATSGIGLACAQTLAKAGVNLILLARRADRLRDIRRDLERNHGTSITVQIGQVDVRDLDQIRNFVERHQTLLAQTDVLINNAGLARGTENMYQARIEDWDEMVDTNIKGLLYMTRAVLPHMVKAGRGHIVNLGSVAGRWVYPGGGVYCATKFAVRALSEGLRMDLLGTPIRVTNIEPGMAETEFSAVRLGDPGKAKAVYSGMTPLSAQDIAETIVWCLSRPQHVNIQELVIFPTDQAAISHIHRHSRP